MFYDVDEILKRYAAGEREFLNADICDSELEGVDLSGINLSGANLSRANLSGVHFSSADLTGAVLRLANLTNANFTNAVLEEVSLSYKPPIFCNTIMPDGSIRTDTPSK